MRQRGRKGTGDIAPVVTLDAGRPVPPEGLSEAEREIFLNVALRLPKRVFPAETWEMSGAYARHCVSFRTLSKLCGRAQDAVALRHNWDIAADTLDKLLRMRERESRAMTASATKLRLTNQAGYDTRTAAREAMKSPGRSAYDLMDLSDD